ncbi:MAG: glycosyltransferase family 4 protein, partial [Clostridiales bacterium]|nr:glycosyltransferase family 4 protein [Clostridiales bacterium]
MKKIKIGFFNSFFPVIAGGSEYQTYLLSQMLGQERFDYFFVSLDTHREGLCEIDGTIVYFFKANSFWERLLDRGYISNFGYLKEVLQHEKPDIVYQRMANSATGILQYLSRQIGFKFIWACANRPDIEAWRWSSFKELKDIPDYLLKMRGISRADILLAQTEEQKSLIKMRFSRDAILLRNGHPVPDSVPKKSRGKIKIVWVANFKRAKQPEIFINLAARLKNLKNAHFYMIGRPGSKVLQHPLELRIQELSNIDYLGSMPQADVNSFLENAHVLVNTSQYEGFSNTFIQAWMREIPVVSLNV